MVLAGKYTSCRWIPHVYKFETQKYCLLLYFNHILCNGLNTPRATNHKGQISLAKNLSIYPKNKSNLQIPLYHFNKEKIVNLSPTYVASCKILCNKTKTWWKSQNVEHHLSLTHLCVRWWARCVGRRRTPAASAARTEQTECERVRARVRIGRTEERVSLVAWSPTVDWHGPGALALVRGRGGGREREALTWFTASRVPPRLSRAAAWCSRFTLYYIYEYESARTWYSTNTSGCSLFSPGDVLAPLSVR